MAGCEIVSAPSEAYLQPNGGTGSVTLNIGLAGAVPAVGDPALSRTVYPIGTGDDGLDGYITKYVVSFTGGTHADVTEVEVEDNTASVTIDDLAEGDYTVTVTGSTGTGTDEKEVAKGSVDVQIKAGETAEESVVLGPSGDGKGTFSYDFDFPAVDSGKLYIYDQDGAPLKEGNEDVVKDLVSGTEGKLENLPAGTYQAVVLLTIGTDVAWRGETVHVYAGKTSPWTHTFTADEFVPPTPIAAFALDGLFTAPIAEETADAALTLPEGANYTGTIAWTYNVGDTPTALDGPFAVGTVYTAVLTLKAEPGFTFEGVAAASFTHNGTAGTGTAGTGKDITVNVVFTATVALVIPFTTLDLTNQFAAPKTGEASSAEFEATDEFAGSVKWTYEVGGEATVLEAGANFAPKTAYTAVVTLTAKPGYTFTDFSGSFTYEGATVENEAGTGKTIEVTVAFAAIEGSLKIGIDFISYAKIPVKLGDNEVSDNDEVSNAPIVLYRNSTTPAVFSVDDEDDDYTNVKWYIGSTELEDGSLTVSSLLAKDKHTIMVFATKGGIPYSRAITFAVEDSE
jgi:hypothetical protein